MISHSSGKLAHSRSRRQESPCLVRTHFLVCRWPSCHCILTCKRSKQLPGISLFGFFFFLLFSLASLGLSCSTWESSLCHVGYFGAVPAGSVVVAHRPSCLEACGILVPLPGMEPVSPAPQGRFLTTGPPGKLSHEGEPS